MCGRQAGDCILGKTIPLERHDVNASWPRRNSFQEHVRRHVMKGSTKAGEETVAADRHEVMHGTPARQGGVIVNMHVTRQ